MEGLTTPPGFALAAAVAGWLAVSIGIVAGRVAYDRRESALRERSVPHGARGRSRLLKRARAHRTERGKWRRISALRTLALTRDLQARRHLRWALADRDPDVVGAAVRVLGEIGDDWAVDELIEALRTDIHPRSRVATQLDDLGSRVGPKLVRLLGEDDPAVRFWAATLLGGCAGVAPARLVALTRDPDANVRAAAVEAIGERGDMAGLAAASERLLDDIWFVRVHAYRSVGRLGGISTAPTIAAGLRDPFWWVRTAAKDALRELGPAVAGALIPYLEDDDAFARNGAAEVLQDVGFLDGLARQGIEGELLERIFSAGGDGLREAAARRAAERPTAGDTALRGLAS